MAISNVKGWRYLIFKLEKLLVWCFLFKPSPTCQIFAQDICTNIWIGQLRIVLKNVKDHKTSGYLPKFDSVSFALICLSYLK